MITRLLNVKMSRIPTNVNIRRYARRPFRCDAHMNELPVPCGPWEPLYKKKQAFYEKVLMAGVLWFIFSISMVVYTGAINFYWGPPAQPSPPSDMVEECDDNDSE